RPAVDHALRLGRDPFDIEGLGVVTDPLRRELIDFRARVALDHDLFVAQAIPERLRQNALLRDGERQARRPIELGHQSGAPAPKRMVLTGVTWGPAAASEPSTSATWLVDSPRS